MDWAGHDIAEDIDSDYCTVRNHTRSASNASVNNELDTTSAAWTAFLCLPIDIGTASSVYISGVAVAVTICGAGVL